LPSRETPRKNPPEFFAQRLQDAKLKHEKTLLSRQVDATDAAIDTLVYDFCGQTEIEIKIIEWAGKK